MNPSNEVIAFAYRSGEIGFVTPIYDRGVPSGALFLARGPADKIYETIGGLARRAYDNETLLVPGCHEAENDELALKAFTDFFYRVNQILSYEPKTI